MKHEEYINKLDNLNEEFEEGLLFELHEKPPTNLHGEIMKSINRERKRINFFNYKIYAPAVAAVLLFAVAINRPELFEKLNFNRNTNIAQNQKITNQGTNTINTMQADDNVKEDNTDTAINVPKTQGTDGINSAITGTQAGNNDTAQQKSPDTSNKNNSQTDNGNKSVAANEGTGKTENPPAEDEGNQFSLENIVGLIFFKEPEVNYEIVLDTNRAAILNYITENNEQKLNAPNTYKLSPEQFEGLDKLLSKLNIGKKVINESASNTSEVVKINLVNYHIQVNDSQPGIVKFVGDQEKCVKIDKNTYKISSDNMIEFDKMLKAANIKKEFVGESEDEYDVIKIVILNYEANIGSNQNDIVSFLKDSEKCEAVQDNIYKMNADNFSKFKELLNTSMIELKVLNEANSQDILVRVNII